MYCFTIWNIEIIKLNEIILINKIYILKIKRNHILKCNYQMKSELKLNNDNKDVHM
jgi:hypothetical protein